MKEAFLATLLSIGPGPDNQIEMMEIITPVKSATSEAAAIKSYVPAIQAADTKADVKPGIIRHTSASHS